MLRRFASFFALALFAGVAGAQYQAAGNGQLAPLDLQSTLETALAEAPWQLGPLRLSPWFGVRDVAYRRGLPATEDTPEVESDVTAIAGAGLHLFVPFGSKVTLAARAVPEYSYSKNRDEQRRTVGRYGAGLFAYFNRLTIEASGDTSEDLVYLSSELLDRLPQETDRLRLTSRLRIASSFSLVAGGSVERSRHRVESGSGGLAGAAAALDRESTIVDLGVRYSGRGDRWWIEAGVSDEETEFDDPLGGRSNEGTATFLGVAILGNRIAFHTQLRQRSLEPTGGSTFQPFDELTGRALLDLEIGWRLRAQLYASNGLAYALSQQLSDVEDERRGLGLTATFGDATARFFYETGEQRFRGSTAGGERRSDDLTAYGIHTTTRLFDRLELRLGASRTELDSNLPGFDRTLEQLDLGLALSFGWGKGAGYDLWTGGGGLWR